MNKKPQQHRQHPQQQQHQQEMEQDDVRQANEEGDPREQGRIRGVPAQNYGEHQKADKGDNDAPESGRHDAVE